MSARTTESSDHSPARSPAEPAALTRCAEELRLQGRLTDAGRMLEQILVHAPDLYPARLALAQVRRAQARTQEAAAHLARLTELYPEQPTPWWLLAEVYCEAGNAVAAVDPVERYAQLLRHDATAQARAAELLLGIGHSQRARLLIERARSSDPENSSAHLIEGRALFEEGNTEGAIEAYEDAVRLDPRLGESSGGRIVESWLIDLPSWTKAGAGEYRALAPAQYLTLPDPVVLPPDEASLWKIGRETVPEIFIGRLDDAEVLGREFPVIAADGCLLVEGFVTSPGVYPHKGGTVKYAAGDGRVLLDLPRAPLQLDGSCILLGRSNNHYHFLLESLPRIWSIEQYGVDAGLPALVPHGLYPTQLELLAMLGFPEDRLIRVPEDGSVRCRTLYAPSLLSRAFTISPLAVGFLRDRILPRVAEVTGLPRRAYLSRNRMPRRHVRNEADLLPMIERHGFRIIYPEALGVAEQVRLFAQAEAILSPDSSALANLAFAAPGAKVGVLSWRGLHKPLWHCIASHAGAQVTYIHADSIAESSAAVAHRDMHVEPALLEEWLAKLG
jgi:capsular polysaccharide biosynthesis protein/Flp pilus assembly protein TadD